MLRPRLSHFLAISLALHATALLVAHTTRRQRNWLAGPVIVRLVPVPESTRESRPTSTQKAAHRRQPATRSRNACSNCSGENSAATPPGKAFPPRSPAAAENLPDTNAPRGPGQRQTAETATLHS